MRDWPAGVDERQLGQALAEGWGIDATAMEYSPVGAGSYHWVVVDAKQQKTFVTVDDLDDKPGLGTTRETAFAGLRVAMDTAFALRCRTTLPFVVAPLATASGETVRRLGSRYAVGVFPFVDGSVGRFGEVISEEERAEVVDMLAALHRSTPASAEVPVCTLEVPRRATFDAALSDLDHPWSGGPFAESTRRLIADGLGDVLRLLNAFDQLVDRLKAAGRMPVITHGEPHPGNVMRVGARRLLVDWDTVGLAPPERDLWMVVGDAGVEIARYTDATGRPVDPDALALYRLRWELDDMAGFVEQSRSAHRHTADMEHAWSGLNNAMERLAQSGDDAGN